MNIFTQILIGLSPAAVAFLAMTIFQKKHRLRNGVAFACMILFILLCTVGIVSTEKSSEGYSDSETEQILQLAYGAVSNGDTDLAQNLIDDLRENSDDTPEVTLCDAYVHAVSGDAVGTKALLEKSELLNKASDNSKLIGYCDKAINGDSDSLESLAESAKKCAEKLTGNSNAIKDTVEALEEADNTYDAYLYDNAETGDTDAQDALDGIEKLTDNYPTLANVSIIRLYRVRLLVICGEYDKVAENINDMSTDDELLIVSELYVNGLIDGDSFNDTFVRSYKNIIKAVANQVKKVTELFENDGTVAGNTAETVYEQLNKALDDPAIYVVKIKLLEISDDGDNPNCPKAFLQLARMEYYEGEEELCQTYITDALENIGVSDDESFSTPAINIVGAISDKDDPEKLKQVATYVDDLTENASDDVVVKAITGQTEYYSDKEDDSDDFEDFMTDYTSQKRVSLNITGVDSSGFETVKAYVTVDSDVALTADELKNIIRVKDCGAEITDFSVEKVEFTASNILLLCDHSGSMNGQPIESLKAAVKEFAETSGDTEHIALILFDDKVTPVCEFGTSDEDVANASYSIVSAGGTNMYDALKEVHGRFTPSGGEVNVVLLLSDGQDNTKRSDVEIMDEIGNPYYADGIFIYSLGLGPNVDSVYMQTLADGTGGEYVYVNDPASLSSFYDNLRNMTLNQYVITYTAKDTMTVDDRELYVSLTDDYLSNDTAYYSIGDGSGDGNSSNVIGFNNLTVNGLDSRMIYRSSVPTVLHLKGSGFKNTDTVSLKLDGNIDYELTTEYEDENSFKVTLPGNMVCDTYNLRVTINGKTKILENELTVVTVNSERKTQFGPYVFTSYGKSESGDSVILTGCVKLNGFLTFNGPVTLTGDLNGYSITLTETNGSYVKYYSDSAEGFALSLAENGVSVSVPALNSVQLYNDQEHDPESEDYRVDASRAMSNMTVPSIAVLEAPGIKLYPNKVDFDSNAFTTKLPMQDTLIKSTGIYDEIFKFEGSYDLYLTGTKVGFGAEISLNDPGETYYPVNLGSYPIYLNGGFKVKIDTLKEEYSIDFTTKVAFVDADGFSLNLEWKKSENSFRLAPSKVIIGIDHDIKATIGGVPVTWGDFKIGLDNIDTSKSVLNWTLTGSADLSFAKLGDYLPGIDKYFGNPAILKLDDITAELSLGEVYLKISTKLMMFEAIQLGKAEIELGKFNYTNLLLGMNDEQVYGMSASLGLGFVWETDNCDIDISGETQLNAHTRFIGLDFSGTIDIDVSWWVFSKETYSKGEGLIGVYVDHSDRVNFVVKAQSTDSNSGSEVVYIVWNKDSGIDIGSEKL